jgi:hypothetical protein
MCAIDSIAIHAVDYDEDDDVHSFYVEVDYIIVVRHHVMFQQLFSANSRQLGIATDPSVAYATFVALPAAPTERYAHLFGVFALLPAASSFPEPTAIR